jgi:hypothetical protein
MVGVLGDVLEALTEAVLSPLGQEGAVITTTFSSLHS